MISGIAISAEQHLLGVGGHDEKVVVLTWSENVSRGQGDAGRVWGWEGADRISWDVMQEMAEVLYGLFCIFA